MPLRLKSFILFLALSAVFLFGLGTTVSAGQPESPFLDYPNCPQGELLLDVGCQRARLLDPNNNCDLYYCKGQAPSGVDQNLVHLNIFGVRFRLNDGLAVQQLVFVGASLFLAVVATYMTFIGVYSTVKRSNAEKEEDIIKETKTLQNALAGFSIMAVSFVVVQLVATFFGLGSLTQLVDFSCLAGGAANPQCQTDF